MTEVYPVCLMINGVRVTGVSAVAHSVRRSVTGRGPLTVWVRVSPLPVKKLKFQFPRIP